MVKIMFVCLGNICRSPMAEFLMKDIVKDKGMADDFYIMSAATSTEALGCAPHRGTREKLAEYGISVQGKKAVQLTRQDYEKYDYFLGMEKANLYAMYRIFGGDPQQKIYRLLDFSDSPRDIADPWYTGNFEKTFSDIQEGISAFLAYLQNNRKEE